MPGLQFDVKEIRWSPYEQTSPILLQDKNGPCPLIALVNTLILSDDIAKRTVELEGDPAKNDTLLLSEQSLLPSSSADLQRSIEASPARSDITQLRSLLNRNSGSTVEVTQILSSLGDILLDVPGTDSSVLDRLLQSLPLLHTGLDVNPVLTTGGFAPDEMASQIFSVFGLNFVHGWCREDSGNLRVDSVFQMYQSYEAIQEYLLTSAEHISEKPEVEAWLHDNATQLTEFGLRQIDEQMGPDSLAIFFRNNHFSTLYKAENNGLYLLITDDVFMNRPGYVWQSLISVSGGNDLYFTGDFTPTVEDPQAQDSGELDENLLFAKQLQEKEDSAYAQALQKTYEKRAQKAPSSSAGTKEGEEVVPASKRDKRKSKERKGTSGSASKGSSAKKDSCIII